MLSSYLVFAKIDSDIITEEYNNPKNAYDRYYELVHKLKSKLNKEGLTFEDSYSTTDGYDRIFESSLGSVMCGEIPQDLMI